MPKKVVKFRQFKALMIKMDRTRAKSQQLYLETQRDRLECLLHLRIINGVFRKLSQLQAAKQAGLMERVFT